MKRLALLFVLVLALPAWGSIARTGSCPATTGTSCTFSATATGDLKIMYAFRSGSTTPPTLPTGWTSIGTAATASGGTTAAVRVGCNDSSSGSDTGSGTWTNATSVVGMSYSGTAVTSTASCNTVGVATNATSNAKTSTSASYPGINLQNTANTSWLLGFLGGSASSTCTPTGMTSVSATATISGSDSNAVAASWSTTTCTVSSETWISFVIEIRVSPSSGSGATPSVVQAAEGWGTNSTITSAYHVKLPEGSQASNALLLQCTSNTSVGTLSVTDDKSNGWSPIPAAKCTGNNSQQVWDFIAPNVTAGTRAVDVATGGSGDRLQCRISEITNIATSNPVDASNCASASSSSVQSGNLNPAFSGDFLSELGMITNVFSSSGTTSWASGSSLALDGYADIVSDGGVDGIIGSQDGVDSSNSQINPTMTQSGANTYAANAVALEAATAGSAGSGYRVVHIAHLDIGFSAGTHTEKFPCLSGSSGGMLLVAAFVGSGTYDVTTPSDSPSNTWHLVGGASSNNGVRYAYSLNATCSAGYSLTWTDSGGASDGTVLFYEIAGCGTGCAFDTEVRSSGTQTVAGNLSMSTFTPSKVGEIVISDLSITLNTVDGQASSPGMLLDSFWYDGEDGTNSSCDRNNGWMHLTAANTSAITPTWTFVNGSTAVGSWSGNTIGFTPPASTRVPMLPLLGVGE